MPTLHLCRKTFSREFAKRGFFDTFFTFAAPLSALTLLTWGIALAPCRAAAQDTPTPPDAPKEAKPQTTPDGAGVAVPLAPVSVNFRERPKYPTDTQRLRRTVTVDGVMSESEWEPFYAISDGPNHGAIYVQWDDNFLYLAARSEAPASFLFDIDAGGDGWLRGADNLEIVVGSLAEGGAPTVTARLLDAASSKDAPTWNEKAIDPKAILVAAKAANGGQFLEIAIPKNLGSLVLRPGATIGVRGEILPPIAAAAYVPTAPFEPHLLLDAMLVETKAQGIPGVNPRLTISDNKCTAGQKLFATLELLNQTGAEIPIKAVLWTGQGASYNALNTIREVVVPAIPTRRTLKLGYKTVLPADLAVGAYTLTVTTEMEGGKQTQASATFAVVEPLQAQMAVSPEPIGVGGALPTRVTVSVDVFNAVPNGMKCDIELTGVPAGWELEGNKKRGLEIEGEDRKRDMKFNFKVPSITPPGEYPLDATVTYRGRVWKTHTTARIVQTAPPAPAAPPKKP